VIGNEMAEVKLVLLDEDFRRIFGAKKLHLIFSRAWLLKSYHG